MMFLCLTVRELMDLVYISLEAVLPRKAFIVSFTVLRLPFGMQFCLPFLNKKFGCVRLLFCVISCIPDIHFRYIKPIPFTGFATTSYLNYIFIQVLTKFSLMLSKLCKFSRNSFLNLAI